jgi:hypothetical protein
VFVLVAYFLGGFHFDELTTTLSIMIPLFATYTTAVLKTFAKELDGGRRTVSPPVEGPIVFLTFFLIALLACFVFTIVVLKTTNLAFENFEQFKGLLAMSEVLFGIYIGYVVGALFDLEKPPTNTQALAEPKATVE